MNKINSLSSYHMQSFTTSLSQQSQPPQQLTTQQLGSCFYTTQTLPQHTAWGQGNRALNVPDFVLNAPKIDKGEYAGQLAVVCASTPQFTQFSNFSDQPFSPAISGCPSGYIGTEKAGAYEYGVFANPTTRNDLRSGKYLPGQIATWAKSEAGSHTCTRVDACSPSNPCPSGSQCVAGLCIPNAQASQFTNKTCGRQ